MTSLDSVPPQALTAGYRALSEHAAWLDLSARGKIRATGEDRVRLLHAMTTQHIQRMKPGDGAYAFFLNAQGHILGDVNLFCFEDRSLLDTEPETRQKLVEHLDRYIIADDVTVEDVTDRLATIAIEGPEAASVLTRLGAPVPGAPYATAAWDSKTVARLSSTGSDGFFIFAPVEEKSALVDQLAASGVLEAAPEDTRVVRIEHGRPRYGDEITERHLVQETGQLHAVHFEKGCYLGQEIVERIRSRAQLRRVLRRFEIDSTEVPSPGAKLTVEGAEAGEIVSAAYSPALGKAVGLAYIRTAHSESGSELAWGDVKVRVVPAL